MAERWIGLVAPVLDAHRRDNAARPYVLLSDITPQLAREPIPMVELTNAFNHLPALVPLADRVNACILGVAPSGQEVG